ncbi:unnamed protein product [Acanthoscelides obtectus]|uniref:Uncharacterized protein n=1 Tax=Acanthoscelides obtectus TaxID=200917 RepID=A0A9P0LL46_ACAOB|nr:unnamed protein product [Acanthoscelides obtectus]CAK1658776.1 hypothetical protein AOBTE_LOCUS21115 [Acanthoscelides obtectus]
MILGSDSTDWDLKRTSGESVQNAVVISRFLIARTATLQTYRQRQMYRPGRLVNSVRVEKRIGKETKDND